MPDPGSRRVGAMGSRDIGLAVLVCVLLLIGTGLTLEEGLVLSVPEEQTGWLPGPGGLTLVVVGSLVLAFRRVAPIFVLVVATTAALAYQGIGYQPEPLPLGVLVALYTAAVLRRPAVAGVAVVGCVLAFSTVAATGWGGPLAHDQFYTDVVSLTAAGILGYGVAQARAKTAWAEQRAAVMAQQEADRLRAAVQQEQSRIAREVHDIVAHDVSVMVAQAAAARRVSDGRPETVVDALASIETVGRDALDGMRRLVWLLRTEPEDVDPEGSDRTPQPGLDRLPWLVEQVRRAGLPVEFTVRGDAHPLPATVELNAYRIVQEALTNSLKHGPRTGTKVTLDYRGTSLRVEVRDLSDESPRSVTTSASGGFGLISMQQRAAMLGGQLEVGPGSHQGFRVAVELPLTGTVL
jgi:signal transduction histidine kinase